MCDYSLQNVKSRAANVGDTLTTRDFGTGTRGFASAEDPTTAVCLLPGTELAFTDQIACTSYGVLGWDMTKTSHKTAIFRQLNKETLHTHHDALEFPDGQIVLLTSLCEGQQASVLQLPAKPTTPEETEAQTRAAYAG